MRIAEAGVRTGFVMTVFYMECGANPVQVVREADPYAPVTDKKP